jgi:hypothetical protein
MNKKELKELTQRATEELRVPQKKNSKTPLTTQVPHGGIN